MIRVVAPTLGLQVGDVVTGRVTPGGMSAWRGDVEVATARDVALAFDDGELTLVGYGWRGGDPAFVLRDGCVVGWVRPTGQAGVYTLTHLDGTCDQVGPCSNGALPGRVMAHLAAARAARERSIACADEAPCTVGARVAALIRP